MSCFVILLLSNEMQMSVRRFSAIPHLRGLSFPESYESDYEASTFKISFSTREHLRIRKYKAKSIRRHLNVNSKFTPVLSDR